MVFVFMLTLFFSLIMILAEGLKDNSRFITFSFLSLIMIVALLFFYKITIEIDDTFISFKLGIGWFGRKYRIDNLISCKSVKNSIWYGMGARLLPNGWLFNVSGLKAIELSFKDKKSIIRIGTNKPEEIAEIVTKLINKN